MGRWDDADETMWCSFIRCDIPDPAHEPDGLFHTFFQWCEVDEFMHTMSPAPGCQAYGHGWDAAAERQVGISGTDIQVQ